MHFFANPGYKVGQVPQGLQVPWLVKVKSAAEIASILAWRISSTNKYVGTKSPVSSVDF